MSLIWLDTLDPTSLEHREAFDLRIQSLQSVRHWHMGLSHIRSTPVGVSGGEIDILSPLLQVRGWMSALT